MKSSAISRPCPRAAPAMSATLSFRRSMDWNSFLLFCVRKVRRFRRALGGGSARIEPAAGDASRVQSIEKNRDEDQRALHELDKEGVYVQERKAVVDDADKEHTPERAPKTALASEEARSP